MASTSGERAPLALSLSRTTTLRNAGVRTTRGKQEMVADAPKLCNRLPTVAQSCHQSNGPAQPTMHSTSETGSPCTVTMSKPHSCSPAGILL